MHPFHVLLTAHYDVSIVDDWSSSYRDVIASRPRKILVVIPWGQPSGGSERGDVRRARLGARDLVEPGDAATAVDSGRDGTVLQVVRAKPR
jgi:hypothetical protein